MSQSSKLAVILLHDHFDADHLAVVVEEMGVMGAPTIKAVWSDGLGAWVALEGCHRLRAAHALGLTPTFDAVEYSDQDMQDAELGLDYDVVGTTVAEVVDRAWRREALVFGDEA